MSADRHRLSEAVTAAIARGLLPPEATAPAVPASPSALARPWPLLLLSGLGAWLVALPMFGFVGALLGPLLQNAAGVSVVGALVLAAAMVVLRLPTLTPFVEQLAVAGLLVGAAMLAGGLSMAEVPLAAVAALMGVVTLGLATVLPQAWLQVLCGAAACASALFALQWVGTGRWTQPDLLRAGLSLHAVLWLGWGLPIGLRARLNRTGGARRAERLEPISAGWQAMALLGWAAFAGWDGLGVSAAAAATSRGVLGGLSLLSTLVAAALLLRTWPALRRPWLAAVALGPLALAWVAPATGPVLLALAFALTTRRRGRAALAAVVLIGVALGFGWALTWPLADKALLLLGCGLWLAAWAVWGWRADRAALAQAEAEPTDFAPTVLAEMAERAISPGRLPPTSRLPAARRPAGVAPRWAAWAGVACAVATLLVVNLGIRGQEALISRGRPVYVELAPVDPRSLMQGDYMALRYRYEAPLSAQLDAHDRFDRPRARARIDARGVAVLERLDDTTPRAADELAIELTPKGGGWTVVSDAWFFREGEGARWQAARYGEFRVDAQGRALLVGLADANLRPIRPAPARAAADKGVVEGVVEGIAAAAPQPAASRP